MHGFSEAEEVLDKFPQRINEGFHHVGHDLLTVTEPPVFQAYKLKNVLADKRSRHMHFVQITNLLPDSFIYTLLEGQSDFL
jgi:hypothetical protein